MQLLKKKEIIMFDCTLQNERTQHFDFTSAYFCEATVVDVNLPQNPDPSILIEKRGLSLTRSQNNQGKISIRILNGNLLDYFDVNMDDDGKIWYSVKTKFLPDNYHVIIPPEMGKSLNMMISRHLHFSIRGNYHRMESGEWALMPHKFISPFFRK